MAKDLEEALVNIEAKLSGAEKPHMDLGGHLGYIEDLLGKSSGTKLYKHSLKDLNYEITLITTNPQPIDFSIIDNYDKLNDYLMSQNVIRFTTDYGDNVQFSSVQHFFYSITIELASSGLVSLINAFDDWSLVDTTDTVTELYYNLNTYSYYIYLPSEFVATNSVQLTKLIRYQTGAGLKEAKAYVDNAKNNGLNLYMPESDLVTKRKFNSHQEARDFIDTMQTANGQPAPEAIKSAWVIETVSES